MKLYYFETMNPQKVCVTAKYLGTELDYIKLNPKQGEHRSPAHLARNPAGKVPVLVDGDVTLTESMAIMAYLAIKAGSDLWPSQDPARQAQVLRWLSWDAFHWAPHLSAFYFEYVIKPDLLGAQPDEAALQPKLAPLQTSANLLDQHLAQSPYVAGEKLSLADFAVGVLLPYAERAHMPLSGHKNIARWHAELMKLEAWRDPWPA